MLVKNINQSLMPPNEINPRTLSQRRLRDPEEQFYLDTNEVDDMIRHKMDAKLLHDQKFRLSIA